MGNKLSLMRISGIFRQLIIMSSSSQRVSL